MALGDQAETRVGELPTKVFIAGSAVVSDNRRVALFKRMSGLSGIEQRYSVLSDGEDPEGNAVNAHALYVRGKFPDTAARMRLFRDDLEKGLGHRYRIEAFDAVKDPRRDSLFTAYVNERFLLEADGARLSARVESSGVEVDAQQKQQMVWFVLEFAAATPVKRLSLRNVVLQEQFGDQQNIVQVMHLPDEARQTLYFAPGDAKAQEMAF